MSVTRRIFVDTEWTAVPWSASADLLWIGLADESGRTWCGLCTEASIDPAFAAYTSALMQHATDDIPRLSRADLSAAVLEFCAGVTEFWVWIPTLESFSAWSKLGPSAQAVYAQCKNIDLQMLRSLVNPWPATWPVELHDLNQAAQASGASLPPRAANYLHPRVHAEWNRELFSRVTESRQRHDDSPHDASTES